MQKILSKQFWQAFIEGNFEIKFNENYSSQLFGIDNIEGFCCLSRMIKKGFNIIYLSVTKAFFIIIQDKNKLLVSFEYNLRRHKKEVTYYKKEKNNNMGLRELLLLIDGELKQKGISLDHRPLQKGRLPFQKPLKILLCSILWQKFYQQDSLNKTKEIVYQIGESLNLDPISVALYGTKSPDPNIVLEANKIYKILFEEKHNISNEWQELRDQKPRSSAIQIVMKIAKKKNLNPVTIASSARYSKDEQIKSDATRVYGQLQERKHNITEHWIELKKDHPEATSLELVKELGRIKELNPSTVASIGTYSINDEIKKNSIFTYLNLMGKRHNITEEWLKLEVKPFNKAFIIGKKLNIKSISVLFYAIASNNDDVRSESILAHDKYLKYKESEKEDRFSQLVMALQQKLNYLL